MYRYRTNFFTGKQSKHKEGGENNPIDFCTCSKEFNFETSIVFRRKKYCPFLKGESSKSYCYLTNSNVLDTQKSKAVGETIQALEALGLCKRTLNSLQRLKHATLTRDGLTISQYDFFEKESRKYYEKEVVNYGPIVGLLHFINSTDSDEIDHRDLSKNMGRPNNCDKVTLRSGDELIFNDGDALDARTRTTGALQAWLTYIGYARPLDFEVGDSFSDSDNFFSNPKNKLGYSKLYVNQKKIRSFFESKPFVARPLSYDFYIKGVGTAREYSQRTESGKQLVNLALKQYASKIRNRRLLLIYSYAIASQKDKALNLANIGKFSNYDNSPFVVDDSTHQQNLIDNEANFLHIAGAPFLRAKENYDIIYPRVKIDPMKMKQKNQFIIAEIDKVLGHTDVFI